MFAVTGSEDLLLKGGHGTVCGQLPHRLVVWAQGGHDFQTLPSPQTCPTAGGFSRTDTFVGLGVRVPQCGLEGDGERPQRR